MGLKFLQSQLNYIIYKKKLSTAFSNAICLQLVIGLPSAMILCDNSMFMAIFKVAYCSYWVMFLFLLLKRGHRLSNDDLQYIGLGFVFHYMIVIGFSACLSALFYNN